MNQGGDCSNLVRQIHLSV